MKVYNSFCCIRYKRKISFTWDNHCRSLNSDWQYCKTIKYPFEFIGKLYPANKIGGVIPSYHPYWNIIAGIKQYNRIKGIIYSIAQIEAFIQSVHPTLDFSSPIFSIENYNKVSAAEEMIVNAKKSIQFILSTFSFKVVPANYPR